MMTLRRLATWWSAFVLFGVVASTTGCDGSTLDSGTAEASEDRQAPLAEPTEGTKTEGRVALTREELTYDEVPEEKEPSELSLSDEEWRQRLSSGAFRVLREDATELPNSGRLLDNKEAGVYVCAGCGQPLFASETKFESGTGWPSFFDTIEEGSVGLVQDDSGGMERVEVYCTHCGGHLGHVFEDGPEPTGLRYCINSAAMDFERFDGERRTSE